MSTTVEPVTCPALAAPPGKIIVASNVASLLLSTYNREAGVQVTVTCLASPEYQLVGADTLTCLPSGQWDRPAPTCRPALQGGQGAVRGDLTMLPALVVAAIFGCVLLVLVALLVYASCCRKRGGLLCYRRGVQRVPVGSLQSWRSQDWEAESALYGRRGRKAASVSDICEVTNVGFSSSPTCAHRSRFPDTDRDSTFREGSCYTGSTGLTLLHPPPQHFCPHPHHHHSRIVPHQPLPRPPCSAAQVSDCSSSSSDSDSIVESRDPATSDLATPDPATSDLTRPPPSSCPYCSSSSSSRSGSGAPRPQGTEPPPPLKTRVGSRQTYRTWHELFLRPDPSWLS